MKYSTTETPLPCNSGFDTLSEFFTLVLKTCPEATTSLRFSQYLNVRTCKTLKRAVENNLDFCLEPSSNIQGSMSL